MLKNRTKNMVSSLVDAISSSEIKLLRRQNRLSSSNTKPHCKKIFQSPTISTSSSLKGDKKLFTPGPLGVSSTTKEAMLRDLGSRDTEFMETIKLVRHELLELSELSSNKYTSILLQGSGTYGIESVLHTSVSKTKGKLLLLSNGSYGKRMNLICQKGGLNAHHLTFPEVETVSLEKVEKHLKECCDYTAVAIVHCETSTGILNDIYSVGRLVKSYCPKASYIVDAMSSFGAIPINFETAHIDYLITSANKCLEGVPGFAVIIANTKKLLSCKGNCQSLSLDIVDQYEAIEKTGQFRFTPPTHAILAICQALRELRKEGGVEGRASRYMANCQTVRDGMKKFGFQRLITDNQDGYIITSYLYPNHPNFDFEKFYQKLGDLNQVIYPGKVTETDTFRIGNIGHLYPDDMIQLLLSIERVCKDLGVELPISDQ